MRSCLIQGPPGTGKSLLACRTAPRRPVVLIDVDRKAGSMTPLLPLMTTGDLVVHEVVAPLVEGRLDHRARDLAKNEKPPRQPMGWIRFAEVIEDVFLKAARSQPPAAPGGTLVVDSWTQTMDHLKQFIMYHDPRGRGALSDRNWGTFLNMNTEAITSLKSECARWNMDLIVTVHERVSELPTSRTTIKRYIDKEGSSRREFEGEMEAIISPSVDGQFGAIMASYFSDCYHTFVEVDHEGKPRWFLRVLPDGRRQLRYSGITEQSVWEPDLAKLWGGKEGG